ncbi:MAG: FAD/NAD(P)-binding protein [Bacteroidia bacterium]
MKTVVIIGGGFSGMLTAERLLNRSAEVSVTVLNTAHPAGKGIAYDTDHSEYLLNVPAAKMSAFHDQPEHFITWLRSKPEYAALHQEEFVPRSIFGKYLEKVFENTLRSARFQLVNAKATGITSGNKHDVTLDNGSTVSADFVVLATGNYLPARPKGIKSSLDEISGYFPNPWDRAAVSDPGNAETVMLIGTGLTMVDCFLGLEKNGYSGKILINSPRGYLPASHTDSGTYPDFYKELNGSDLLSIFRIVRRHIITAKKQGIPWQAVIDAVRPYAAKIWLDLPMKEKQQFISHIRHIWGVARHRLPPAIHHAISKGIESGKAELLAGRIKEIAAKRDHFEVSIIAKADQKEIKYTVERIINCTGPRLNFSEPPDLLIEQLQKTGFIVPHELKMGIKASPKGNIIQSDGKASLTAFAIGSLLRGVLWETTAVPEIRMQAEKIAKSICSTGS